MYPIEDDEQFALDLLLEEKVLVVQGSGFNWPYTDHFRVVFLPNSDDRPKRWAAWEISLGGTASVTAPALA